MPVVSHSTSNYEDNFNQFSWVVTSEKLDCNYHYCLKFAYENITKKYIFLIWKLEIWV